MCISLGVFVKRMSKGKNENDIKNEKNATQLEQDESYFQRFFQLLSNFVCTVSKITSSSHEAANPTVSLSLCLSLSLSTIS